MRSNFKSYLTIGLALYMGAYMSCACAADTKRNDVTIFSDNELRYITSNGIPTVHGEFPNAHNPNTIQAQHYHFKMPLYPQMAKTIVELQGFEDFGVGIDGVPFDPGTAEFWNGNPEWRYEALSGKINLGLDQNNAHVQPNGAYHYHGLPTDLLVGQSSSEHSKLIGYAADGFPIYAKYGYVQASFKASGIKELKSSWKLRPGDRPAGPGGAFDGTFTQDYMYVAGAGDLDECNGRYGVTPEYPAGTYHYFITADFPIVPRCFKGNPDESFMKDPNAGPHDHGHYHGPDDHFHGPWPPPPR